MNSSEYPVHDENEEAPENVGQVPAGSNEPTSPESLTPGEGGSLGQGSPGGWTYPLEGYATGQGADDLTEPIALGPDQPADHRSFNPRRNRGGAGGIPPVVARQQPLARPIVGTVVAAAVIAATVSGGVSYFIAKHTSSASSAPPVIKQVTGRNASANTTAASSTSISGVLTKVEPAVVDITARGVMTTNNGFFGGGTQAFTSEGTGMIISPNGYVLTNNHVVAGSTSVSITLFNQNKAYPARVVGTDPTHDVALLQIRGATGLPTVTFGDSASLKVGDSVVAIGNALGLNGTPTVTQGIISALGRAITAQSATGATENLSNLIQTDAPINPGNSGGPLINSSGNVIGMNTAAASGNGGTAAQNIGFAEPINSVLQIVKSIEAHPGTGTSSTAGRGYLGVGVQNLTASLASQLGYSSGQTGVLVDNVVGGSPASQAGISSGDVITTVDGQNVTSVSELVQLIQSKSPGSQLSVAWLDPNTGRNNATVTLASTPVA